MKCPECEATLKSEPWLGDAAFACPSCRGRAVPVATLQRAAQPEFFAALQKKAADSVAGSAVACPACRRITRRLFVPSNALRIELELCRWCRLVWFDPAELQQVPTRPRVAPDNDALAAARRALAIEQVRADAQRSRDHLDFDPSELSFGRQLLVFFGFPMEESSLPSERRPWLTWSVAAALVVAWLTALADPAAAVASFGFVPDAMWESGGLTLLSSFFVHVGFWHVLGNVWLLVLAGDDLEERLGRGGWVALLVGATLAGNLLHALFDARGDVPCVGASGGVSGLLACYALLWPHARIVFRPPGLLLLSRLLSGRNWWEAQFLALPSWLLFAGWMVLQCFLAWLQSYGASSVSGLAHLGGAAVGVVAGIVLRQGATKR